MEKKDKKKVVLVDGSSYLFRAYHALPPLTTSKGIPTGAVYGVINMLRKLQNEVQPEYIAVVFDTKSKNFRHELYSEYKANRPPMPEDLSVQIQPMHEIIKAMGLPLLAIEGIEADDLIGTLANEAKKENYQVVISTGDKDFAQMVDEDITLINTMTNVVLDVKGVEEKFGVSPEQIVDYLALIGDTVDNIPGVPKVGPKTAVKWLKDYGTLKNIIENAGEIKGKVGDNLRESLVHLELARKLVTIKKDMPLNVHVDFLKPKTPDNDKLRELFTDLEFKTWLKALASSPAEVFSEKGEYHHEIILDKKAWEKWLVALKGAKQFAFDTETTSLDGLEAELVGFSVAITPNEAAYIPLAHDYLGAPKQLNREEILKALKPLLENQKIGKIGQNIKYDMHVLKNYDITLQNIAHDSMLLSYVFNSQATRHDMDSLAKVYLNYQTITYADVAGKGAKQIPFNLVPIEIAGKYSAEDASVTLALTETLWEKISDHPGLVSVYENIEIPL
ncbi:MAG TPA: 5'-3' exonuclease H3TH domain-containing protein, partial [Gammaproteobacteria bacterium]|nr:5'-3' exonuclease H3TH domain-containing protein [Gammaproteobacteria bacterium]